MAFTVDELEDTLKQLLAQQTGNPHSITVQLEPDMDVYRISMYDMRTGLSRHSLVYPRQIRSMTCLYACKVILRIDNFPIGIDKCIEVMRKALNVA